MLFLSIALGYILFLYTSREIDYNYSDLAANFIKEIISYHPKYLIYFILFIPLSILLSFIFIGPVILIIYMCYICICYGLVFGMLFNLYSFKILILLLLLFLLYILIPCGITLVNTTYMFKISYIYLTKIILKRTIDIQRIIKYIKRVIKLSIISIIYLCFLYYCGGYLLKLIAFFN